MAQALQDLENRRASFELHRPRAVLMNGEDAAAFIVAEMNDRAELELSPWANERTEGIPLGWFGKQIEDFRRGALVRPSQEARRQDTAAVDDQ